MIMSKRTWVKRLVLPKTAKSARHINSQPTDWFASSNLYLRSRFRRFFFDSGNDVACGLWPTVKCCRAGYVWVMQHKNNTCHSSLSDDATCRERNVNVTGWEWSYLDLYVRILYFVGSTATAFIVYCGRLLHRLAYFSSRFAWIVLYSRASTHTQSHSCYLSGKQTSNGKYLLSVRLIRLNRQQR